MAKLSVEGIERVTNELSRVGNFEQLGHEMLKAGAKVTKQCWKNAIQNHNLIDSHDMIKSIGYTLTSESGTGRRIATVYPKGKDENGVRNAEKAAYNHYGTFYGQRIKATHFVRDVVTEAKEKAVEAMEEELKKHIQGGRP